MKDFYLDNRELSEVMDSLRKKIHNIAELDIKEKSVLQTSILYYYILITKMHPSVYLSVDLEAEKYMEYKTAQNN